MVRRQLQVNFKYFLLIITFKPIYSFDNFKMPLNLILASRETEKGRVRKLIIEGLGMKGYTKLLTNEIHIPTKYWCQNVASIISY